MKAYIVTLTIVDHDEIGAAEVSTVLENARYPNRCIYPNIYGVESFDVGEWDDDHPLNKSATDAVAWLRENGKPTP